MKLKLYKIGFYLVIKSRWFKYWSKFYRFLFERKYNNVRIDKKNDLEILNKEISKLSWQKDGLKELYDTCRSPKYVQHCLYNIKKTGIQPLGALDCDDFAVYCGNAFYSDIMFDHGKMLLTGWFDKNNKYHAHMVYVHYHYIENKYSVISNWGLEYKKFNSIKEVVKYVLGDNTLLVGTAIYNPKTLDLLEIKIGE